VIRASWRRASWSVVLLLVAGPAAGEADSSRITIAPCVEVSHDDLRRLLDLELSTSGGTLQIAIGCDDRAVTLEVADQHSGRRGARSLQLERTAPEARARLVALAAAELTAAVLSDEAPAPAISSDAPPAVNASGGAMSRPAEHPLPLSLLAEAGGARFFSRLATTVEVGLTLRYDGWRVLEPSVILAGSLGGVTRKGREATAGSLSLSPLLGVHHRLGRATARAATGPRIALGRLRASAALPGDQPGTFTAPWLGWLAQLGLGTSLGPRLFVELVGRTGYVLWPIGGRIAGGREIAVEGFWIGGSLSLGARL
jgi:hypothetical protein